MKALVLAAMIVIPGAAHAEQPTLDEVKALAMKLAAADSPAASATLIAAPFAYVGISYQDTGPEVKACTKKWKTKGTVKPADRDAFAACLQRSDLRGHVQSEWLPLDLGKLPARLAKHKKQLAALAKDHTLALSYLSEGDAFEGWWVYAGKKTGTALAITAIISVQD